MKAIVQERYGSPDVLELREVDVPQVGDGEVLIRVLAAGVSAGVWHLMTGEPYALRLMGFGFRRPKVEVPGADVSGRVEAVGDGVTEFRPGDEVFGSCDRAFAEYACAHAGRLTRKPANITFEQAAAVQDSGCTAYRALQEEAELRAGQSSLIIGAAGGVGTFAVQIAKAFGATVTGVCSTAKVDLVRTLGADYVVDYTREDITESDQRYDVIVDIAGRRPVSHLRRILKPDGTLVLVGGEGGGRLFGGVDRQLRAVILSRFVRHSIRAPVYARHPQAVLRAVRELIERGDVTPVVGKTFPLEEAAEAMREFEQGHARGKIVLTC